VRAKERFLLTHQDRKSETKGDERGAVVGTIKTGAAKGNP
jgi:hypothetical protein